ncbi:MAG: DUF2065 domain-containing protein [Methylotenera sp.]|nr:MAG: DUF2065 domain-containing protein [Methylotenera sp.]
MNCDLLTALGLMLILEGVLPLLVPKAWRETFQRMIALKDGQLRFVGLISILGGLIVLWLGH